MGFESRWHYVPVVATVATVVGFTALYLVPGAAGFNVAMAAFIVGGPAALASYAAYYREANLSAAAGMDWVPTWWAYCLGGLVLTPAFVAPVYVLQRWRHIGLGAQPRPNT